MALEGPQLRYARAPETERLEAPVVEALELARRIESLLEAAGSGRDAAAGRIARGMSASLVDELDALVRRMRRQSVA